MRVSIFYSKVLFQVKSLSNGNSIVSDFCFGLDVLEVELLKLFCFSYLLSQKLRFRLGNKVTCGDKQKMASSEEILRETMDWFFSNDALANKMEHWAKSNCDAFDYCAEQDDFEKVENKLVYTDLYKQFVDLFESEVAAFLQTKGWSIPQLAAACGEDESGATLGLILAITDYPVFKSMMLDEKRKKVQAGS